jgi:hypothetical protein
VTPRTEFIAYARTSDYLELTGPVYQRSRDWLEGRATIRRAGRRLAFATCEFRHGGALAFTTSAIFAITP